MAFHVETKGSFGYFFLSIIEDRKIRSSMAREFHFSTLLAGVGKRFSNVDMLTDLLGTHY